jgi:energy-converting hydrogenase Eha subunit B
MCVCVCVCFVCVCACVYMHAYIMPHLRDDASGGDAEALAVSLHHRLCCHPELGGHAGPIDQDVICCPLEAPHGDRHGFHGLR